MGLALAIALLSMLSFAGVAQAARIVGMTDDGTSLIAVDSSNPAVLVPPPGRTGAAAVPITGIPSDEIVTGIDFRARDGALFAVTKRNSGQAIAFLHRINIASGQASQVGGDIDFPNDVVGGMDFISSDSIQAGFRTGTQDDFLIDSESGVPNLLVPFDYPASATDPRVAGLARDPVSGTVFALDDNLNQLSTVSGGSAAIPSGGGVLTAVGPTGVDINGSTGFDVSPSGAGFVSATGIAFFNSRLYTINLGTGAMTFVGALGSSGTTRYTSISVVPSGVLSVSDAVVTEDGSAALVRVDRTGGSLGAVSATLSPADGSATAGGDYDATPRTVDFSNGDTSETALIPIANDGVAEPRETFTVNLSAPTGGADIGRGAGTVTIVDEDSNAPDTARPTVALAGLPRSMRLRKFLRGVSMRVTPNEPVALEAELRANARRARIAAFNLTLGTRALPLAAGTRVVRLRLSRRVRRVIGRPPRRFRAQVVLTATDAAGNRSVVRRTIRVRR